MNKTVRGAMIGGVVGITAPIALAVANEFVWSRRSGGVVEPRICFADRLWNLQRVQIVHAPGCKNIILNSIPLCLLVGVFGGSLISSLSLITKETQKQSKDSPPEPASASTPPTPVAGIKPPTAPVEKKLTIPSISQPSISPQINKGVDRLKGLDWNSIAKGTAVAVGVLVIGFGAVNLLKRSTEETTDPVPNPLKHLQQSGFQIMGTDGYKWSFDKEGVTCITEETPSVTTEPNDNGWYTKTGSYVTVYCQGFGFNEDQTGKKFHYSTKNTLCQRTGYEYWESSDGNAAVSGTLGYEDQSKNPVTSYRDPQTSNHVICQAGRHYNMF